MLGLLIFSGIGYGLFVVVRATIQVLAALNSSIAVAIIAAAATIFVSALSIVLGKLYESRSLIQKEHRETKIPVYEDFLKFISRILMSSKVGDTVSEKEMIEFMSGFTQHLMVWGSDEVLVAWVKCRRLLIDGPAMKTSPTKFLFLYEDLVLAIRRDLGHKNKSFVKGDVLALFINDIDQHLPNKTGVDSSSSEKLL